MPPPRVNFNMIPWVRTHEDPKTGQLHIAVRECDRWKMVTLEQYVACDPSAIYEAIGVLKRQLIREREIAEKVAATLLGGQTSPGPHTAAEAVESVTFKRWAKKIVPFPY